MAQSGYGMKVIFLILCRLKEFHQAPPGAHHREVLKYTVKIQEGLAKKYIFLCAPDKIPFKFTAC